MAGLESSGTRNLESDGRAFGELADRPEIMEVPREDGTEGHADATNEDPLTRTREMAQEGTRGNPNNGDNAESCPPSGLNRQDPKEGNDNEQIKQPGSNKEPDLGSMREESRTRFYKEYRREAEEYDKGFIKKYDEDLNTTLIFAGLFSAVTSAFAILVRSDFKQDPNEETAALLRIIIYKMDNTTFGGDIPTVPQWTGPPHASVEVQAMLAVILASSLFCAFLAMLGKQWLNRYESIDVRGSAIKRCQNRQQKLDGIVTWYFKHVMESLPLMSQGALMLFGCALSRYFWEINTTVASVILAANAFGILFSIFVVVAGTAYASCPYQTPFAQILRYALDALDHTPNTLHRISSSLRRTPSTLRCITTFLNSTLSTAIEASLFCRTLIKLRDRIGGRRRSSHELAYPSFLFLLLPILFLWDTCCLVSFVIRKAYLLTKRAELDEGVLDQRCILWTLQSSLDKPVRLSALDYLSVMVLPHIDPTLVTDCFDTLNRIIWRVDEVAKEYTLCCLSILSHLTVEGQSLKILEDISERHARAIYLNFTSYPLLSIPTLHVIRHVFHGINPTVPPSAGPRWDDYNPTRNEHIIVAHALAKISRFEFKKAQQRKVPRYLLRFALHSLSLDLPPPTSVIANSLLIIAIDLGCDVNAAASDESGRLDWCNSLITKQLNAMIEAGASNLIFSKRKAICALLPYAVTLEQRGQPELFDMFLRAAQSTRFENFMWIRPLANTLFSTPYPRSLDRLILLATNYAWWDRGPCSEGEVARWASAVSAVPYTEEVGECVVDALFKVAAFDPLGLSAPRLGILHHIRGLGNIEILKFYLLIAWQSRDPLHPSGFAEMKASITEDFAGVGVSRHRRDLIRELEQVRQPRYHRGIAEEVEKAQGYRYPVGEYMELKELLLQVDMEAERTLTSTHSTFMCALPLHCP